MNEIDASILNSNWIVSKRGKKNEIDFRKPYAWLVEKECTVHNKIEDTAIIFLSNKECSFKCLMCDLWKNTSDKSVTPGDIPAQIEWALERLPTAKHLKLYNSGSFFDERAIPEVDYERIAALIKNFETVIVESHPKLINEKCLRFRDMFKPELEIAIGLETVNEDVLFKLNKQMTLEDFENSIDFLTQNEIRSRAFILLRPPFMTEPEGVYWAKRSIDFAFKVGVACCTVIPVRAGNGAMDLLMKNGDFSLPNIHSLETVLEYGIEQKAGRVFADVWDLELFSNCDKCITERSNRLSEMNLSQKIENKISCVCNSI